MNLYPYEPTNTKEPSSYNINNSGYQSFPKLYELPLDYVDATNDMVDTETIDTLDTYVDKKIVKLVGPPSDYVSKRPPDETISKVDQQIDKNKTTLDYFINLFKL
jgi:hypothetical protein